MNIVVPVKLVPDLVEELTIDASGTALDTMWLRFIINEFDDHAIEQAVLLKESIGGHVTVLCPDMEGADDLLFTASAKGADRIVKLRGDFESGANNHGLARALAGLIKEDPPDLVLTGVQANNDLDGSLGSLLAEYLEMPYVGYISGVALDAGKVLVRKEFPGGLVVEMEVMLPAVLGIQAATQPPRYVAISKVRQAMKTATLEEQEIAELDPAGGPTVSQMSLPEASGEVRMFDGDPEEVAANLVDIFKILGVL